MADDCCAHDTPPAERNAEEEAPFWQLREVRAAAAAGMFLGAGLLAGLSGARHASTMLFVVALVAGGSTFVPQALRALWRGRLSVGTLMAIAAIGAVALGEVGEAASLAFLFSISEALEGYALSRARRGLRALLSLVPERVTVLRQDRELEVDPAELVVGDMMVITAGERVPTDGVVRSGRSAVDFSAVTGESVPVEVETGSVVYAAAINGGGLINVEVRARVADSSLARIVRIVEEAQERKGHSQRLAERVARPLVPGIMIVAAAIALVGSLVGDPRLWLERSLVVLVAAAPCAFAISVPVTVVAAIGAATRMGALVKGGLAMEALAGVRVVALDKTGTLTRNEARVVEVVAAPGEDSQEVLSLAAALEARSDHPLAAAILAAAPGAAPAADVQAIAGSGLTGSVQGQRVRLGKPGFVDGDALRHEIARLQSKGCTVVLVDRDDETIGAVAVRDELRPEAVETVRLLREQGIERIVMLTGDNQRTADAIGATAGVDEVHAELLPADKVEMVQRLRSRGDTAMVGDGINDAPALASADVGIAMGAMGSDVAIEAADVALMGEELTHLPEVLAHARRAGLIMRQNLALSALILLLLIPLAAFGVLGLAAVVAVHELAEVLVIANGVRAGRSRQGYSVRRATALPREPATNAAGQ